MDFPEPRFTQDEIDALGNWTVLIPTGRARENTFVPEQFREAILLHVVKNFTVNVVAPLILIIQGRPGEGKSYLTREICAQSGIYVVTVSGATLSGSHEGDASKHLQHAYMFASRVREKLRRPVALLVDDFDLSVASRFARSENTVNTQLLTGFIMNLADDPTTCAGHPTQRVPIILTGNDFAALHAALVRPGRVENLNWVLPTEEKWAVVQTILEPALAPRDRSKLRALFDAYSEQPVAFFDALRSDLANTPLRQAVARGERDVERLAQIAQNAQHGQPISHLVALAAARSKRAEGSSQLGWSSAAGGPSRQPYAVPASHSPPSLGRSQLGNGSPLFPTVFHTLSASNAAETSDVPEVPDEVCYDLAEQPTLLLDESSLARSRNGNPGSGDA